MRIPHTKYDRAVFCTVEKVWVPYEHVYSFATNVQKQPQHCNKMLYSWGHSVFYDDVEPFTALEQ